MASDGDALIRSVCEFPDDHTPRLALADWWRENGRESRAEFVRLQFEFDALPGRDKACPYAREYLSPGPRAGAVPRWETGACRCRGCRAAAELHSHLTDSLSLWAAYPGVPGARTDHTDAREWAESGGAFRVLWQLGFAHAVACPAAEWLRAAGHLLWVPACGRCGGTGGRVSGGATRGRVTCPGCGGTGRNPAPCPPTAHPIRRVALTTEPRSAGRVDDFALRKMGPGETWRSYRWPGVRFVCPGEDAGAAWGKSPEQGG